MNTNKSVPTVALNARIPATLKAQLEARAKKLGLSLTAYMVRIFKEALDLSEETSEEEDV